MMIGVFVCGAFFGAILTVAYIVFGGESDE